MRSVVRQWTTVVRRGSYYKENCKPVSDRWPDVEQAAQRRLGRCEHAKIPFPSSAGRSAEGKLPVRLPRRKRHLSPACLPRRTRSRARTISSFDSLPCRVARDNRSRRENDARVGARERNQHAAEPGDIRYSLYASVFQVSD